MQTQQQGETAAYLESLGMEMATLARKAGLSTAASLFGMAALECSLVNRSEEEAMRRWWAQH